MGEVPQEAVVISKITIVEALDENGAPVIYYETWGVDSSVKLLGLLERTKLYAMGIE